MATLRRNSRQINLSPRLRISAPGSRPRFHQDLESVADAQHQSSIGGEFADCRHDGRELGDGAAAQVIAVGEAAGEDHGIDIAERGRVVPDEFRGLSKIVSDRVKSIVIAVASRKNNDAKFHGFCFRAGGNLYFTRGGGATACAGVTPTTKRHSLGYGQGLFGTPFERVAGNVLNYVVCAHQPALPPLCFF